MALAARAAHRGPGASDVEVPYAIGAGDTLVAAAPTATTRRRRWRCWTQSGAETNLEQIVALKPDAVVMPKMAQEVAHVEALVRRHPVVMTDAQDIKGVHQAIRLLAR